VEYKWQTAVENKKIDIILSYLNSFLLWNKYEPTNWELYWCMGQSVKWIFLRKLLLVKISSSKI